MKDENKTKEKKQKEKKTKTPKSSKNQKEKKETGKSGLKTRETLKKIFGTYEPASWMKKVGGFFKRHWKLFLKILGGILSAFVLFVIGLFVYKFIQSKIPVKLTIDAWVSESPDIANNENELTIRFDGSVAKVEDVGKILDKSISSKISIKPEIYGEWEWKADDRLHFSPKQNQNWNIGTTYKISLPKELFPNHINLSSYQVDFSTDQFTTYIAQEEFYVDDIVPTQKFISFQLRANYPIDEKTLLDKITFEPDMKNPTNGTLEKRKYKTSAIMTSEDGKTAYIYSEFLGTPATTVKMNINVGEGVKSIYGGKGAPSKSSSVTIQGAKSFAKFDKTSFNLIKNEEEIYEQIVMFEATAKLSSEELKQNLELYILPKDKPDEPGMKGKKDFNWQYAGCEDVTNTVLKESEKLDFEILQTETTYEKVQSAKVEVKEKSFIYGVVKEGTKFYGDYYLNSPHEFILYVPEYPAEASILSEGDIISMRGSHQIPILTRGVENLEFSVWRLQPDEVNHLVSQSNGNLKNFRFSNWNFDQNNIGELYTFEKKVTETSPKYPVYSSFDFSQYLNNVSEKNLRYGVFYFKVQGKTSNSSRVKTSDERLIIVTDQAIIHKKGTDNWHDFFIQSISSGTPVASSIINVISLNGDVIASGQTDANGHVKIQIPESKQKTLQPVAYTATRGNDFVFMPYNAYDRRLDYSDFDVGGEYGLQNPNKLNAYIFSDRGIYRPGENVKLGAIIKANDWKISVDGLPFIYTVTDSKGTEIAEKEFTLNEEGFHELSFDTKAYSPTGIYTTALYIKKTRDDGTTYREYINSCTVKVEEFLPDTLAITSNFDPLPAKGWIQSRKIDARVTLKNLFGTNAVGNTVQAEITLTPGYMRFPEYKDYKFSDPYVGKDYYSDKLTDKKTDENGIAVFPINIEKFAKASYRLTFTADGLEKESGRNVTTSSSLYISPLDYMIGVKSDGSLSYINHGSTRVLKFIAISPELKQIAVDDAEMSITENRYISALVKQPNGSYKYQSVKKEFPISSEKIKIPESGYEFMLPSEADGDFVLTIKNAQGDILNSVSYSIIGTQNLQRSLSRTAELEVKTSKSSYNPGENAEIFIKAPYAGSGLITIEREKVYTYKWFRTDGSSSTQTIRIPTELEGNGYINIMFLRDYNSKEIYMSPFCYAAIPFSVSEERRINHINLSYPTEVKPGTDFEIKYSTEKPGQIVIFAVDEGILQVAKYKSPEPLPFFFRKQALQVNTEQLLDLVLPEFNILKTLTAMGGGGDYDLLAHNLNPFKRKQNAPVAYWSGIIPCDSKQKSVTYHIPDYFNGSMRVMAVAVSNQAVGTYSDSAIVKDNYVIVPNTPTFASPNDELEISVTVTNNNKGSGENAKVVLSAETDGGLEIIGDKSIALTISEGLDSTAIFKVKAKDVLGNADIKFMAKGEKEFSKMTSSLSIRPAMPYQVWITSGHIDKNKTEINVNKSLYDEFATREINLSALPVGIAKGLSFYLKKYPHNCSEQVTSRAYPFLFADLLEDKEITRQQVQEEIDDAISILASRQRSDGTIGYWTYKSPSYPLLDAYVALFLTDAQNKGYYVPQTFMARLLSALGNSAKNADSYLDRAFSIFVLTKNEMVTTSYVESLKKEIDKESKVSVAGTFLAATYKMLQMENEGNKLISKIQKNAQFGDEDGRFTNSLFFNAAYLYLLSEYYPEKLTTISSQLLEAIEKETCYNRFTSISSAFTLISIDSYLRAVPDAKDLKIKVSANFGKNGGTKEINLTGNKLMVGSFEESTQKLEIENKDKNNIFYQVTQAGYLKTPAEKEESLIEVYREFTDENGKKISSAKLGDVVNVNVNIRSKGGTLYNVVLIDMLPSGLEADTESIRKRESDWNTDYVDIREDRVIFYGKATNSLLTYSYKARAINKGTFTVPPLYAEAMYNRNAKALRPQENFTVTNEK